MDQLYNCTCSKCGKPKFINAATPEQLRQEAERIAKGLYNGTITSGTIDIGLTREVARELRKAVIEGFGKDLPDIDYGTPDYNMLVQLEKNVWQFSAAKNYQQLKSMSLALIDENGKRRDFKGFKEEALKISGEYNGRYLLVEYNTATGSATMAGKWVDIEQNKAAAPYLRYDTVGDGRVRDEHRKLDGIILLVDDQFWAIYYPPNGWGCRCDVTQLLNGAVTRPDQIQFPDGVPDMFKTNLAKSGLVFPSGHPYYTDMPENLMKKAVHLRDNKYSKIPRDRSMKADVLVSNLADKNDLETNIQLAKRLAAHEHQVHIEPHIHASAGGSKNPEIKIAGVLGDFKVLNPLKSLKNSIEKNIKGANTQGASIPVLVVSGDKYDKGETVRALNNLFKPGERSKETRNITHVWFLFDNELIRLARAAIEKRLYYRELP